jgi:hypothetical protein
MSETSGEPTEGWTDDKVEAAFEDLVSRYGPRPEPVAGVVAEPSFIDREPEHFEPPEPPPLPEVDRINRFAWVGVIGGPAVLLLLALTGYAAPGWLAPVAVASFIGGFVTLVARAKGRDSDDDGAVV